MKFLARILIKQWHLLRKLLRPKIMHLRPTERIFSKIYRKNYWGSSESVSGTGSILEQTEIIRKELPPLFLNLGVHKILDIPCGDFNWMRHLNFDGMEYMGADIVKPLVEHNQQYFHTANISFSHLNLLKGPLPQVDLILCRDCLVHLSFQDVQRAITAICKSGSQYLLTTTFIDKTVNNDIVTGEWRPLNLELAPFNFPKPMQVIIEGCTEVGSAFKDKSLALWKISDIKSCSLSTNESAD